MRTQEILTKYLDFYQKRDHKLVPNVSLIPENDPTLLFVNSGMFPLVPYLSGEPHPLGKRLVNVQRAMRFATDLNEIGDSIHTVAFHMIGNWSLGDYFKNEQLPWAYEFLIEELGLDADKLITTVFEGDKDSPKDTESIEILKRIYKKYGIDANENERIFARPKKDNWWQRGDSVGELGGPDSEIHYYLGQGSPVGKDPIVNQNEFVEIGNSVFMQYKKSETGWEELPQKNVDFGGGLERIGMVVQGKKDIFETDNFWPIIEKVQEITKKSYKESPEITVSMRTLADHMRACVFLAMDGVVPGNKDQGYVLRRLIRRMVKFGRKLGFEQDLSVRLVGTVTDSFGWLYPELPKKRSDIEKIFESEEIKFLKTLHNGSKHVEKYIQVWKEKQDLPLGEVVEKAFDMYQSMGYPAEIFLEDLKDSGIKVDPIEFISQFDNRFNEHQSQSRSGAEQKFRGGLADHGDDTVRYHTATHLLQMALKKVIGEEVVQLGSNITNERLRFDFPNPNKLSESEILKVQNLVNEAIESGYPVNYVMLPKEQAIASGAHYMKHENYPDTVKVYYIGENLETAISKEFCGGPHVTNTNEIGKIEIYKQENIGEGKIRLYAKKV